MVALVDEVHLAVVIGGSIYRVVRQPLPRRADLGEDHDICLEHRGHGDDLSIGRPDAILAHLRVLNVVTDVLHVEEPVEHLGSLDHVVDELPPHGQVLVLRAGDLLRECAEEAVTVTLDLVRQRRDADRAGLEDRVWGTDARHLQTEAVALQQAPLEVWRREIDRFGRRVLADYLTHVDTVVIRDVSVGMFHGHILI